MKVPPFEAAKLDRLLRTHGVKYTFSRAKLTTFGEPDTSEAVAQVTGVFHTSSSRVVLTSAEGATLQSKQTPSIFTRWEYAKGLIIGDMVTINEVLHKVTGLVDYNGFKVYADISLEAVV